MQFHSCFKIDFWHVANTTNHYEAYPISPIFNHLFQYFRLYFINGSVNIDLQCFQSCCFVWNFVYSRTHSTKNAPRQWTIFYGKKCINFQLVVSPIYKRSTQTMIIRLQFLAQLNLARM